MILFILIICTGPLLPIPTAGVGNPYQNFSWTQLHDTLTEKVQQNDDSTQCSSTLRACIPPTILPDISIDICLVSVDISL